MKNFKVGDNVVFTHEDVFSKGKTYRIVKDIKNDMFEVVCIQPKDPMRIPVIVDKGDIKLAN